MIETGGSVHRDTLQFVKIVNAPVGVDAKEMMNRAAMARIVWRGWYWRNAWSGTTPGVHT